MRKRLKKLLLVMVILTLAAGADSCACGRPAPGPAALDTPASAKAARPAPGTALVIRHTADGSEVPFTYLADDAGWRRPYSEPRRETSLPPPSDAMHQEYLRARRQHEPGLQTDAEIARRLSWTDQDGFDGISAVLKGEYNLTPRNVDPPYGCNNDGANGNNDHAFEDVIRAGTQNLPQSISYVLEGYTTPNWFNTTGGSSNSAYSAVYQLFSTSRSADPTDFYSSPYYFEELSYRSDLAPGVPPGGDCSGAEAYLVDGLFWKRFNLSTTALPNAMQTKVYNILIAPAGPASGLLTSSGNADGRFQPFYFGNVRGCYGGAWITGIDAADTGCAQFDDGVAEAYADRHPYYYLPVYGLLLKRWQDTRQASMAGPWEGGLGWPVDGPYPYLDGAQQLGPRGTYYAWGMWYERGFMWWVDYDQSVYPAAPDEAQLYGYSGINVYGHDGDYFRWGPTVFYGDGGELGGTVVLDYFRFDAGDPWTPVRLTDSGTACSISIPNGVTTVYLAMHCTAQGGTHNEDWRYKYYAWDFGDGATQPPGAPFDPGQALTVHTYDTSEPDLVVRVQITDADDATAYADSLPLHFAPHAERKAVLLVSQSHGFDADFSGTNAWNALFGFDVETGAVPAGGRDMIWAAGLATDAGVGPGGEYGVFPTAPQNISGEFYGGFSRDSVGCAERYTGSGSSGWIPERLTWNAPSQYCGLGYYGALMGGREASPGFRAGVAVETETPCPEVAFVSWGNVWAPDEDIGFAPTYSHVLGERRLWVIGYPWALMGQGEGIEYLLKNILAWLDSTVGERVLPAEIMLIRADGDVYDANYDALYDDLEALQLGFTTHDYSTTTAEQFHGDPYKIAIWYRGGPGDAGEPQVYTTPWTSEEYGEFLEMLE